MGFGVFGLGLEAKSPVVGPNQAFWGGSVLDALLPGSNLGPGITSWLRGAGFVGFVGFVGFRV